jgi:hypothetical protein
MEWAKWTWWMEQWIFCIFIDYREHHRKGVAIYNATEVNLQQKLWFRWTKNVFVNTTESFKDEKLYQLTIFLQRKNFCWPFHSCSLYAYVRTTQRCTVPLKVIKFAPMDIMIGGRVSRPVHVYCVSICRWEKAEKDLMEWKDLEVIFQTSPTPYK